MTAPPQSSAEALARAAHHGRAALAEALAALEALVDALALSTGTALDAGATGALRESLQRVRAWAAPDAAHARALETASVLASVAQVLDAEIKHWEEKGRADADARMVLRALLTVREIIWELAQRAPADATDACAADANAAAEENSAAGEFHPAAAAH